MNEALARSYDSLSYLRDKRDRFKKGYGDEDRQQESPREDDSSDQTDAISYFREKRDQLQKAQQASQKGSVKAHEQPSDEKRHATKTDSEMRENLDRVLNEIKGGFQATARGVAPFIDFVATPGRHAIEKIKGHKIPTMMDAVSMGYEQPIWEDEPKKAMIHHGLEFAGSMIPSAGVGSALMKAGEIIPKVGRYVSKAGQWLGGGAMNQALKGAPAHLGEMVASSVPMGMASQYIQKEGGIEPFIADILGSITGGVFYGAARHPDNVMAFAKRVINGEVGQGVRYSFLKNLKEALGEGNIHPLIEKIESYEPILEGHKPTVAEMTTPTSREEAMLPHLASLERSQLNTPAVAAAKANTNTFINEALGHLENPHASMEDVKSGLARAYNLDREAVEDIIESLRAQKGSQSSTQDVGETLREQVASHLDKAWKKRKAETKPHWDKVDLDPRKISPEETRPYVNETLMTGIDDPTAIFHYKRVKETAGQGKKDVEDINDISSLPENLYSKSISNSFIWPQLSDAEKRKLLTDAGVIQEADVTRISQLSAERKRLLHAAQDAKNSGDANRYRYLNNLEEKVRKDLYRESKDAQKAVEKYAEFSPPINKIENVPSNATMTKKYFGEPQVLDTTIGESFTQGKHAPEKVQKLNEAFETRGEAGEVHKEAVADAITSHAQHELMDKVVTKEGLVDLAALRRYESRMTGVQEVNPGFTEDLKALGAAQANLENQFGRKKGGAKDVLIEGESKHIIKEILGANNKQKALTEVLERLAKVGEKDGREGIMNGILEHMQESVRGRAGDAYIITPSAFKTYMKKHHSILKAVLDPDQMRVLEGISKIMGQKQFANVAGGVPGSETKHLLSKGQLFSEEGRGIWRKLLHATSSNFRSIEKVFSIVSSTIGKDVKTLKSEMLQKFLTDSEQALKDLRGTQNIPDHDILEYTKHSIPRNILSYLISE